MIINMTCPDCGKFYKTKYWFEYHYRFCRPVSKDLALRRGDTTTN
jgi:hypothetical protein